MENLFIKETPTTPEVAFKVEDGIFEIKGVSIPEDTEDFYNPLLYHIEEFLTKHNPTKVTLALKLIYVNTSTSGMIGKIIKLLENTASLEQEIIVQWFYETEDEDMKDLGEDFHSFSTLKFEMIPCEEIS
jgi:hypothetical protein